MPIAETTRCNGSGAALGQKSQDENRQTYSFGSVCDRLGRTNHVALEGWTGPRLEQGTGVGSDSLTPETFNQALVYNRFATLAVIINIFHFQFVEARQVVS